MDYLKILDQLTPDSTGNVLGQISDTYLVARNRVRQAMRLTQSTELPS
jgi:hypothetical protein